MTEPGAPGVPGYEMLGILGQGGFGVVYRARQLAVRREVALKVDNRVLVSERDRRRFMREVSSAGALSGHPHVAHVYDAGVLGDGRPYMVLELCPGGSLSDRLRERGPLPAAEVRDIGVRIADALAAAHAAGVLHRDVKPANILINRYGMVALSDFGLAATAHAEGEVSVTRESLTPAFGPPEAFELAEPSPAGDVYSLAATLYALLNGRPPRFPESGVVNVAMIMALHRLPVPEIPGVPPQLTAVLRAGLATHPRDRLPSAAALRDALSAVPAEALIQSGSGSRTPASPDGHSHGSSGPYTPAAGPSSPGADGYAHGSSGPYAPASPSLPHPPVSPSFSPGPSGPPAHAAGPPASPYASPGSRGSAPAGFVPDATGPGQGAGSTGPSGRGRHGRGAGPVEVTGPGGPGGSGGRPGDGGQGYGSGGQGYGSGGQAAGPDGHGRAVGPGGRSGGPGGRPGGVPGGWAGGVEQGPRGQVTGPGGRRDGVPGAGGRGSGPISRSEITRPPVPPVPRPGHTKLYGVLAGVFALLLVIGVTIAWFESGDPGTGTAGPPGASGAPGTGSGSDPAPSASGGGRTGDPAGTLGGVPVTTASCPATAVTGAGAACGRDAECWGGIVAITGAVSVRRRACEESHVWETFAIAPLPKDAMTFDLADLEAHPVVKRLCSARVLLGSRTGTARAIPSGQWMVSVLPPSPDAFKEGVRIYRCVGGVTGRETPGTYFRPSR
ncbi:serine/threonine-protein kinase [Sphaerisporangium aureirubrum]|uniref:non-specific serine/threonine protein kinase n=1 Tax=Sphaerisporangium aureirubrum TaxID=1544736 RepID=A0ABW1NJ43_9ACTN